MVDEPQELLDRHFMARALQLAVEAAAMGEVPVGALIVKDGEIIAEGWNRPITTADPSAHAEMIALRGAAQVLDNYRLLDTTLYVTLEPCVMCSGALIHARVKRVVFGAFDDKTGAFCSAFELLTSPKHNHQVEVTAGLMAEECGMLLSNFFRERRLQKRAEKKAQQK